MELMNDYKVGMGIKILFFLFFYFLCYTDFCFELLISKLDKFFYLSIMMT